MRQLSILLVASFLVADGASAAARCGNWVPQTNGSEWRVCVSDAGVQYCERRRGREIKRMICPA